MTAAYLSANFYTDLKFILNCYGFDEKFTSACRRFDEVVGAMFERRLRKQLLEGESGNKEFKVDVKCREVVEVRLT